MGTSVMYCINIRLHAPIGLIALLILAGVNSEARAATGEARVYMDVEYAVVKKDSESLRLVLKPFLRIENRFRDSGLVYEQWNAGFKLRILSWLSVAAYYTPRELLYPGKPDKFKNTVGADIVFHPSFGSFRFLNREANEWHATDMYYRYRNLSEVMYTTTKTWLSLYAYDEFRFDTDKRRVNMKNIGGGFEFDPKAPLTLRVFYDLEGNRRELAEWEYVHFIGASYAVHL